MDETRVKPKKSLKERLVDDIRKDMRLWRGCLAGVVAGYAASFFFQPAFIREKLGFFGYFECIFDILFDFGSKSTAQIALTAWISMAVGSSLGAFVEKKLVEKGKIRSWARRRREENEGEE